MKNKLKYYLRTRVLYVVIPFLFWNCENEDTDDEVQQGNIETVAVNEAIDFFNVKASSNLSKPANPIYAIPHLDYIFQEEITNSDALLTLIPATTIHQEHYSRILLLKINNEIQSIVFSMYASDDVTNEQFSGEIIITDLNGNFLNGYRISSGEFITQFRKSITANNTSVTAKTSSTVCPDHGECVEGSNCIVCLQELEEVVVTGNSGNTSGPTPFIDLNDFPGIDEGGAQAPDMGMEWDYGPGEGSSPNNDNEESSCPDGYTKDNNGICVVDDKIINELTGKEKCIHDLLNEAGNSYIKDILSKFEGDSEFDIKIESKNKVYKDGKEVAGGTSKPLNGMISIQISTSSASDRSALSVAKTILHEYIHADMYRKLSTKYLSTDDLDFKKTYEEFENQKFEASAQHETMAELYIDNMRDALKDFHKNIMTADYNYFSDNGTISLDSFYEALAWIGLKEHNVKAYVDLPDGNKQELEEAINLFYHGITKNCPEN